jgi:lipid-A-disaccharide synthase
MRLFVSAGEASGDAYGAALVGELRALGWNGTIEAMGGTRLRQLGATMIADSTHWGAISIVQSLAVVSRVTLGYHRVKRRLAQGPPGLFVAIDYGYVNIRLAKWAKAHGWRVLYFVPPGSWRRDRQGADLPKITDAIVTPFPWSADLLNAAGANAHFFGHPIKQLIRRSASNSRDGLAILPGSRHHEIENNLPIIAKALAGYRGRVEFAIAPSTDANSIRKGWQEHGFSEPTITVGDTAGVLARSETAIVCSGTATLEAALTDTPMVILYQISKLMEFEAKLIRFKVPKFTGLPNIILDRSIVPELVGMVDVGQLKDLIDTTMNDSNAREQQRLGFRELSALLGQDDAISQAARLALSLFPGQTEPNSPAAKG